MMALEASPGGAQICDGMVMHARLRPVSHQFVYPVAFCLLPLHRLGECGRAFFGINRWNLLCVHERDYGGRDGSPLIPWFNRVYLQQISRRATLASEPAAASGEPEGPITQAWLQTFPRVLGYVFNPVSFWYGYRADGSLIAILAEVSNTFGERHNYLLAHPDGRPIVDGEWFERDKVFHVSPFFPVRGQYRFKFNLDSGRPRARIDYSDSGGELLRTAISGLPAPLTGRRALSTFLRYPLLTFGVVARIHWQAALLYFGKRVQFFRKPAPPTEETTS
jgi:uncharacterized protein